MIRLTFPDPADSPTQRSPLRIRYAMTRNSEGRTVPELSYAHGKRKLTRDAWQGFSAAGARIGATTEREAMIVCEVLGTMDIDVLSEAHAARDQVNAAADAIHAGTASMQQFAKAAKAAGVALQDFKKAADKGGQS